eukprot:m.192601 g.192601  ORF g.192601 m.192601 type:complete len:231 (-) comp32475_c2_seq2:364-1056(-)
MILRRVPVRCNLTWGRLWLQNHDFSLGNRHRLWNNATYSNQQQFQRQQHQQRMGEGMVILIDSEHLNSKFQSLVNRSSIITTTKQLKQCLGFSLYDVGVSCVSKQEMASLNKNYRGRIGATDVLSFPYADAIAPGKLAECTSSCDWNLGDIVLCPEVIAVDADEDKCCFQVRLPIILAHSLCHLVGFTHDEDADEIEMHAAESHVLQAFARLRNETHDRYIPLTRRPFVD